MEITTQFAVLVPAVMAFIQALKLSGLKSRYAPVLSIILGVIATFALGQFDLVQGLLVGLTASGLFSGVKATVK
jgi:hypothetical protein